MNQTCGSRPAGVAWTWAVWTVFSIRLMRPLLTSWVITLAPHGRTGHCCDQVVFLSVCVCVDVTFVCVWIFMSASRTSVSVLSVSVEFWTSWEKQAYTPPPSPAVGRGVHCTKANGDQLAN